VKPPEASELLARRKLSGPLRSGSLAHLHGKPGRPWKPARLHSNNGATQPSSELRRSVDRRLSGNLWTRARSRNFPPCGRPLSAARHLNSIDLYAAGTDRFFANLPAWNTGRRCPGPHWRCAHESSPSPQDEKYKPSFSAESVQPNPPLLVQHSAFRHGACIEEQQQHDSPDNGRKNGGAAAHHSHSVR
jgi:hypothetical protein